jgi:predicted dehydrogenase
VSGVRVAVIGCGLQGSEHLRALSSIDDVEVAAIADLNEARLAEVGERFGVAHRYTDASRLLEHDLDLVTVCTMPDTHSALVIDALAAGANVLCEKPLARSAAEALPMVRAAEEANRLLMVGFNMRYMSATAAVRRFVAEGLLGDFVCARGFMLMDEVPWWGKHYVNEISGGGALNATAIHMLDLLSWLAGNPKPLTATASMATVFPAKRSASAPPGAAAAYDVEDVLFGHVRFEGGFWISLEGTWVYDRPGLNYSFDLLGTRGQAHLDPLELFTERDGQVVEVSEDVPADLDIEGAVNPTVEAAVASTRAGEKAAELADGREALVIQAIVDALYRSARAGHEVEVEVPADPETPA